jgi:hypothetical protein
VNTPKYGTRVSKIILNNNAILAEIRPSLINKFGFACFYLMAFVFYGPMAVFLLIPFGLIDIVQLKIGVYVIATMIVLFWIHTAVRKQFNELHFCLTKKTLTLGNAPTTLIAIDDIAEALAVRYQFRPFQKAVALIVKPEDGFNLLLLRLRNGNLLPLMLRNNVNGFGNLFAQILTLVEKRIVTHGALSNEEIYFMFPARTNKLHAEPSAGDK